MINGSAPDYLYDLIQPCFPVQHAYNLRSGCNNLCIPVCKTMSYYNSFIRSTVKLWNSLTEDVKNSPSLAIFKAKLKNWGATNKPCRYFNFGNRKENILHCQLRNNASNLNAHLKNHFLSDIQSCQKCGFHTEDTEHYFINCPSYNVERNILVKKLNDIDVVFELDALLRRKCQNSYQTTCKIFSYVQEFIKSSKRLN